MRRFARNAAMISLLAGQFSCYAWKNVSLVENADSGTRPTLIEVTRRSGGTYDVYYPMVTRDSLHGWVDEKRKNPARFALSEIERARTKQISSGRTAAGIALGIVAAFGIWWLLLLSSDGITY